MFALDVESLSDRENGVVLSIALLHFSEKETYTFQQLVEQTCFVKLSAKEQVEKYKRRITKDTLDWWDKQCDIAKEVSLKPSKSDLLLSEGISIIKRYIKDKSVGDEIVWTRGSLDQILVDSVCKDSLKVEPLFNYGCYRDFRTAIDLLKETSKRGYCEIPNFDRNVVIKHHPVHDIVLDVMMLLYGE